jgi:hypothetical protein
MKQESLVKLCFPEPPTPTRRIFPPGELITLVILKRCLRASSKITKFIFLEENFSLKSSSLALTIVLIASRSGAASYTYGASSSSSPYSSMMSFL